MPETELLQIAVEVLRDVVTHRPPKPEAVAFLRTATSDPDTPVDDLARKVIEREIAKPRPKTMAAA